MNSTSERLSALRVNRTRGYDGNEVTDPERTLGRICVAATAFNNKLE
jgi:hypothetical protein